MVDFKGVVEIDGLLETAKECDLFESIKVSSNKYKYQDSKL